MSNQMNSLHVAGPLTAESFTPPAQSIGKDAIKAGAGIEATKVQQQVSKTVGDPSATTAADKVLPVHSVHGATGTLVKFEAGTVTPCIGDSTIEVDLLKNGTTVLASPITLDDTSSARVAVAAAGFSASSVVDGDMFEVSVNATVGTGTLGSGFYAQLVLTEDPQ